MVPDLHAFFLLHKSAPLRCDHPSECQQKDAKISWVKKQGHFVSCMSWTLSDRMSTAMMDRMSAFALGEIEMDGLEILFGPQKEMMHARS